LSTTLADNLRFLRALIARPKNIGALMPSSPALAEAIARQIDPHAGPVLEIGAGTGVVSEALLARGVPAERLTLLEYDEDMASHLADRFSRCRVIRGDAFNLDQSLGRPNGSPYGAIVSGIPLLNHSMPRRQAYVADLFRRMMPDAPLVQFSYGTQAPVKAPAGYSVVRAATVLANIPPAKVWVYRKT
jgi:phosphatidylethanolamine/phosphatidyl-N-methylethanolamine N-methyltransferase